MHNKKIKIAMFVLMVLTLSVIGFGIVKTLPVSAEAYTQHQTWINSYGDQTTPADDKIKVLADIQPGFGIQMQEVGRRFTAIFNAARGGNWGLAKYQLKELREAAEVAEVTRPKRKDAWVSFEDTYLGDATNPEAGTLQDAINKENFVAFHKSFKSAIAGCNGCHQASDFPYILYKLPRASELPLDFFLKLQ